MSRVIPWSVMLALLIAVGCGGGTLVGTAPTESSTPKPASTSSATAGSTTTAAPSGPLAITLTDVRSGEAFTLGQFAGKVTIVQHMAVW